MPPYPTWPSGKRWPFALLAACHTRAPEVQHIPDRVCDDLVSRGWVERHAPPDGFADHHATIRTTPRGRGILRVVDHTWCLMAATDGVRLLAALRAGDVVIRDDWSLELVRLSRWAEYRVTAWREPAE